MRGIHLKSHVTLQLCGHLKMKNVIFLRARGRGDVKGKLVLAKINTKMPTKTKNVWHYFRGSLPEVSIVVFILFFKIYRKDLCKSLRVGVSFLIKLTEQSFISHYKLQLYNKRPQHGLFPANLAKLLRFLPEHPQANTFAPFRQLWDFTTALKTVAVFLLFRCDSFPCAALRKQ